MADLESTEQSSGEEESYTSASEASGGEMPPLEQIESTSAPQGPVPHGSQDDSLLDTEMVSHDEDVGDEQLSSEGETLTEESADALLLLPSSQALTGAIAGMEDSGVVNFSQESLGNELTEAVISEVEGQEAAMEALDLSGQSNVQPSSLSGAVLFNTLTPDSWTIATRHAERQEAAMGQEPLATGRRLYQAAPAPSTMTREQDAALASDSSDRTIIMDYSAGGSAASAAAPPAQLPAAPPAQPPAAPPSQLPATYSAPPPLAAMEMDAEQDDEGMDDASELSDTPRPLDPQIPWGKQVTSEELYEELCEAPQGIPRGRVSDYLGPDLPAREDWLHQNVTTEQRTAALPHIGYRALPRVKPECSVAPIQLPFVHNTREELTALLHAWADCDFQCPYRHFEHLLKYCCYVSVWLVSHTPGLTNTL